MLLYNEVLNLLVDLGRLGVQLRLQERVSKADGRPTFRSESLLQPRLIPCHLNRVLIFVEVELRKGLDRLEVFLGARDSERAENEVSDGRVCCVQGRRDLQLCRRFPIAKETFNLLEEMLYGVMHNVNRTMNLSLLFAICLRRIEFLEERELCVYYIQWPALLFVGSFVAGVLLVHEGIFIIGERGTSSHCERRRL